MCVEYFYDHEHGGGRAARAAAVAWRKKMERLMPPPMGGRKARTNVERGVIWRETREVWDRNRRRWFLRDLVHGFYPGPGGRLSRSRSVTLHGEDAAVREVTAWLLEQRRRYGA